MILSPACSVAIEFHENVSSATQSPDRVRPPWGKTLDWQRRHFDLEAVRRYLRLRVLTPTDAILTAGLQSLPATMQSLLLLISAASLAFPDSTPFLTQGIGPQQVGRATYVRCFPVHSPD